MSGLPYPGYFPFDALHADTATPDRLIDVNYLGVPASLPRSFFSRKKPDPPLSSHITIPKSEPSAPLALRIDVATCLQYGRATALDPLADFLREFTFKHMLQGGLAYEESGADIAITLGNTDGFAKVIAAIGTRGDIMLVEEFCFPAPLQHAAPYGIGTAPVKMENGVMAVEGPGGLRDVLENWDPVKGKRPHFMYTITVGQNPTGGTINQQRRREIYSLCEKFDILIIEDDPYWHLQYTKSAHRKKEGTEYPFLAALEKSYLSVDVSGRVIRLDTFSKTIAPGCRLGWITAQKSIINAILAATETSTQQPSGFVQSMVAELLCRSWKMTGWIKWLESLRDVYEKRMRLMADTLEHGKEVILVSSASPELEIITKSRMYSFKIPDGGMFIWVHVHIANHPAYQSFLARGNTKFQAMRKLWEWIAITQKSLAGPGDIFAGHESTASDASERFRLCFSAIELDEVLDATERWVKGICAFWSLQAREIEEIGMEPVMVLERRKREAATGGWGGFRGGKGRTDISFE